MKIHWQFWKRVHKNTEALMPAYRFPYIKAAFVFGVANAMSITGVVAGITLIMHYTEPSQTQTTYVFPSPSLSPSPTYPPTSTGHIEFSIAVDADTIKSAQTALAAKQAIVTKSLIEKLHVKNAEPSTSIF